LNLLRLAVVEIFQEGGAAYGVVNAAVSLARADKATTRRAGLVNAVLRNVLRASPVWDDLPMPELPKWLRKPLVATYGKASVAAMEAVHAKAPPLDLTCKADSTEVPQGDVLPTGSIRLVAEGQISAMTGYAEGAWWVQDAAAALPARMLGVAQGDRVLDLCAAPGGKTLQLADTGADVTALDISDRRMARLRENLARTGLVAHIVVADAHDWQPDAQFDAILLDAPCSATGTLRRHPDLPFAKGADDIPPLVALQQRLLDRALDLLRPGGRLVYCTCSLLPEEGELQLSQALSRHPGLSVIPAEFPGLEPEWIDAQGGLRLRPDFWADRGGMDGFYAAHLQKPA
jgi:16S rRNA (cytosine967-C5)-methyltransferase